MSSLQKFHRRTQSVGPSNNLHTGTISITGTVQVGQTLSVTSTIADVDGLGTFVYQWKRAGTAISGATSSTYTLVAADVGNTITVTITYTDGKGYLETETSASTVIVPKSLGSGSDTIGYYIGAAGDGTPYLYVAPQSTTTTKTWGSNGTVRSVASDTDGLSNTNTLNAYGATAHPAANYAKTLTTGGYNTWYLPAINELKTIVSNRASCPNVYFTGTMWSSTEDYGGYKAGKYTAKSLSMTNPTSARADSKGGSYNIKAVRKAYS